VVREFRDSQSIKEDSCIVLRIDAAVCLYTARHTANRRSFFLCARERFAKSATRATDFVFKATTKKEKEL
jgi:hypothetical protein